MVKLLKSELQYNYLPIGLILGLSFIFAWLISSIPILQNPSKILIIVISIPLVAVVVRIFKIGILEKRDRMFSLLPIEIKKIAWERYLFVWIIWIGLWIYSNFLLALFPPDDMKIYGSITTILRFGSAFTIASFIVKDITAMRLTESNLRKYIMPALAVALSLIAIIAIGLVVNYTFDFGYGIYLIPFLQTALPLLLSLIMIPAFRMRKSYHE